MKPLEPHPVKLIIGILYSDKEILEKAIGLLNMQFGKLDYQSQEFEFTITDYYVEEMGSPIFRCFISFLKLIHPKILAQVKIDSNKLEEKLSLSGHRKINLDPGYMDYDKIVLASAKYNGQKIYLDLGIWADLTLRYEKNCFHPYPWSFPDFKSGIYNQIFLDIRQKYKTQMKKFNNQEDDF